MCNGAPSFLKQVLPLVFNVIALLEAFNTSRRVHHAPFAGEEGVAVTADFYSKFLFRGAGSEFIAAGAYYHGVVIVLGMNFLFHSFQLI